MERQAVAKVEKTPPGNTHRQSAPSSSTRNPLLELQRSIGNQAIQRLTNSSFIQAKLQISTPGDESEQEADRVADTVMRMPEPAVSRQPVVQPVSSHITPLAQRETDRGDEEEEKIVAPKSKSAIPVAVREDDEENDEETPLVQRACDECEEEMDQGESVVHRESGTQTATPKVTSSVAANIHAMNGNGSPLSDTTREFFEPRFGADFSQVRVHTDSRAAATASSINAKAFTVGHNIAFGTGQYAPESDEGKQTLAHELTHVVQQGHRLQTVQRQPKPPQKKAGQDDGYQFKITVSKPENGSEFMVTTYAQAFRISRELAKELARRHPGEWTESKGDVTAQELKQKFRWVSIDPSLYDTIRNELNAAATNAKDPKKQATIKDAATLAKEAADRAATFKGLSQGEQKKINDEANKQFEAQAGYKPAKGVDQATDTTKEEELQRKIRDELLRIRTFLGTLPEGVRDALGDPSKYSPAQYDQLLRIGNKLAALGPDDLALYRIIAGQSSTNLDAVEKALDQFIEFKEKYRNALEKNAVSGQDPDEVALQKELDKAWEGFDKSNFHKLGRSEKAAVAREIAYKRSAAQLKYMASHPGKTAVGMVKGLNPAEVYKGIEKDIKDFRNSESSWGKWAAGTGIGSKVSGWVAGIAAVAWVVMWFIPGVNLINAMATAMSIALYAGLAAIVLSGASQELHIQAAGEAKTEKEFETHTNAAADELASAVSGLVLLVGGFGLKILGRIKFAQRYLNIGRVLNDLKVKAYMAMRIDALKALRRDAIAALSREMIGLEGEMKLAQGEHAALRREIAALSPPELMRKIATDARFAARLGMDPQQAKAFGPAAEGPLATNGAPKAKASILQAMDDAAIEARARVDKLKADVDTISSDLNSAETHTKFNEALDRAIKTTSAKEQARVADEARRSYEERARQSAANELKAEAERIRAAGEDVVSDRVIKEATNRRQGRVTADPNAPALGADNLKAQGYVPDRIFMDSIPGPIPPEGWKLHVSATAANAEAVASTVLPLLRKLGVNHKVVGTAADLGKMTGTQAGKFVTIYPDTAGHAVAIVKALDGALAGKGFSGPAVSGEIAVGNSGMVYSRYGGFTKSTVTDPAGLEVPDVRGQAHPPWIDNVWEAGKVKGGNPLKKPPPNKVPPAAPVRPPPKGEDKSKPVD